jgi:hypothetical protein
LLAVLRQHFALDPFAVQEFLAPDAADGVKAGVTDDHAGDADRQHDPPVDARVEAGGHAGADNGQLLGDRQTQSGGEKRAEHGEIGPHCRPINNHAALREASQRIAFRIVI